ncbi:FAD-dependent oxidoreductase [Albimonas sp. CAU 1670]|uniref:oxidoreductase n=1 Tax=Albimonas sp. CAU 1670 TaxID=3032599 RepID=UPI0023D9F0E2|nr:FAD-dependent oxidoreductase [Albimonas sp. CAU 1670]MDF2232374.1 FAD-dependent oxidoreductase [Albimonas sp. CAU 1670]
MPQPRSGAFPHVLAPLDLGPLRIRNRIVVPAHTTNFGEHHLPSQRHLDYHVARARGGVGAIIFESIRVHLNSLGRPQAVQGFDPACIEPFRRITAAVQAEGAKILGQIIHLGRQVEGDFERTVSWGPSPLPWSATALPPKAMDEWDMAEAVEAHVATARNLVAAGFDGIELQMAHGHLLPQFMSPLSNRRTDEYGGSLENRLRFPIRVLRAVREAVGPDMCLGVRLSGEEWLPEGLHIEEAERAAVLLAQAARVDFFNVSHSAYHASYSLATQMADMAMDPAPFRTLPARIRAALRIEGHAAPVFAVCRFTTLAEAEAAIADGTADAVAMARAHLAEPAIVKKTLEGREDEIRPCIACNQGCAQNLERNLPLRCLVNPMAGLEGEWAEPEELPAPTPRRVLVVGGGSAGMEAARTAAARGHAVTLWEAGERLGGQLLWTEAMPKRAAFARFLDHQRKALERLGVRVELNRRADADAIRGFGAEAILLATGASLAEPALPGGGAVVSPTRALSDPEALGPRIAFVDLTGEWTAISVIERLADLGKSVTVLTAPAAFAWRTSIYSTLATTQRLREAGVRIRTLRRATRWDGATLTVEDLSCGETETLEGLSAVVVADHAASDPALWRALKSEGLPVVQIGDALAPRTAVEAVYAGHKAAREIA